MRSRQRSGGISVVLCAVLLLSTAFAVAASAEPPLTPTSRTQKLELLRADAAQEREQLAKEYPFLQMPDMTPVRVVADDEWPLRMTECLRQFGVDASVSGTSVVAPELDPRTLRGDVVNRTCELRYPKESRLQYVLGPYELRQLWTYYVFDLQVCLRTNGIETTRSPSFGEYLARRGSDEAWHPYLAIPQIASMRDLQYYDQLCPRFPRWLRV
jgi:hypothetical protein